MRTLVLLLATAAFADSWMPYGTKTFSSPGGKHTLIIKQTREFSLGALKGTLPQLPLEAHVLNAGGAVLFENYGDVGGADSLALLDATGKLAWRLRLGDLFDKQTIATFVQTASSIWWNRAWWADERRARIVLVAKGGQVREVELASGKIALGGTDAIVSGIAVPHARSVALELAAELKLKAALPLAQPMIADAKLPIAVRLRAAIAVQALGGPAVDQKLFAAALGVKQPLKERRYTIKKLAELMPRQGLELLEEAAMRRETSYDAIRALAEVGAARTLASVIASGDVATGARTYASQALGQLPAEAVGEAIAAEIADSDADVAGALLRAGIAAHVSDLSKLVAPHETTLIRALDRGHAPIHWTADHFAKHPSTEAVDALLKTFGKHQRNPRRAKKLVAALKACTGLDFGSSFDAWRKGLRR